MDEPEDTQDEALDESPEDSQDESADNAQEDPQQASLHAGDADQEGELDDPLEDRSDERRMSDDRRQDHDTAAHVAEASNLKRAFGNDAAQRFLRLRGINDELAADALLENYDRRKGQRRTGASASR
jgi:hypothetical protein